MKLYSIALESKNSKKSLKINLLIKKNELSLKIHKKKKKKLF